MTKHPLKSRTILTGAGVTLLSIASIAVETWSLFGIAEHGTLRDLFGPEAMAMVGLVMVFLRVITTKPLGR